MTNETTLGKALPIKYGKARDESYGYVAESAPVYGSSGVIGEFNRALTTGPALIVGRKGSAGSIHYSATPCWPIDTVYYAESPPDSTLHYFRYLLEHLRLGQHDKSTAIPSLGRDDYNAIPVTVPLLKDQERVVAYLDEQLSRLDASVAALHQVQANLKRYRASVLKSACEGRLVPTEAELARQEGRDFETGAQLLQRILDERRDSAGVKSKYKDPSAPEELRLPEAPEGWTWSNVDQLAIVGTGATPKRDEPTFYEGGHIPWVTSGAVNGEYVDQAFEFVTDRALSETNLSIYPPGTLLLAMYGEGKTRGRCSELRINATTNQALAAIQASALVRRYLRLLLERSYEETRKAASGGVQPNLNLSLVRAIKVLIPPLAEQPRIVAEADRRLSLIRVAEAQVTANLARAQRLRQSILRAAFGG
jgi:type I restriction enzyme, S subunit